LFHLHVCYRKGLMSSCVRSFLLLGHAVHEHCSSAVGGYMLVISWFITSCFISFDIKVIDPSLRYKGTHLNKLLCLQ
jgi:hypothetical protein